MCGSVTLWLRWEHVYGREIRWFVENPWDHEFLGLCWVLICKSCLFQDFSRVRQLSFLSCRSDEVGKVWVLGRTFFSFVMLSGNVLSWPGKFLRVPSSSCRREIFNILPVLEGQEVQKGKARFLNSRELTPFLETNQFYPNPLACRNLREFAHWWHYVPWCTCLHWKYKGCWKPRGFGTTPTSTENGILGRVSVRSVAIFPFRVY